VSTESPSHAVLRLIGALEVLEGQERLQAERGDHAGVLETRERILPVVARLAELGRGNAGPEARARIRAVLARRGRSRELIASRMEQIKAELSRNAAGLRMLARVIPLYQPQARASLSRRLSAMT
jgi:hypothetical protein